MQYLVGLFAIAVLIALLIEFLAFAWPFLLAFLLGWISFRIVRFIRKERYFASEEFLAKKAGIAAVVDEHNEITQYVDEVRANGLFELGGSSTGSQAHLAQFVNTSRHNHRRDRNLATYGDARTHNCSLQVVRNAASDPIKYLCKYFDISADEQTLERVEALGESLSRLEAALENLSQRESQITENFDAPGFILKHYRNEFMEHLGVELTPVSVPYSDYHFEYVSAGGNSSQKTSVRLDSPTVDALVGFLDSKIRWRKSVAGQRALMTTKLREFIKNRDGYACRMCGISIVREPHLLLEVDHIIPVSRGGLSTHDNLQTLCWKCNRSKSNKIL